MNNEKINQYRSVIEEQIRAINPSIEIAKIYEVYGGEMLVQCRNGRDGKAQNYWFTPKGELAYYFSEDENGNLLRHGNGKYQIDHT